MPFHNKCPKKEKKKLCNIQKENKIRVKGKVYEIEKFIKSYKYIGFNTLKNNFSFSEYETNKWINVFIKSGLLEMSYYHNKHSQNDNKRRKKKYIYGHYKVNNEQYFKNEEEIKTYFENIPNFISWEYFIKLEREEILKYNGWNEKWNELSERQKHNILNKYLMKSYILSLYTLINCKYLIKKERIKLLGKIKHKDSFIELAYVLLVIKKHRKISDKEKELMEQALLNNKLYMEVLEYVDNQKIRDKAIEGLFNKEEDIEFNCIRESDLEKLVLEICKLNNAYKAFKYYNNINFNEEQKKKIAPMAISYKLINNI